MRTIGRYEIEGELGHGAMGVVYLATDPTIGRKVAIKTIRFADGVSPAERARLKERLFREARSAGILSHPGIVTVYDIAEYEDIAYIAMEFVNGPTLEAFLASGATLTQEQALELLRELSAALDYAHRKGIIHRDIKPANIMLTDDKHARITDFGIAKLAASDQFTHTGTILGTPNYMSPEQVQGKPVDGRADQYALAVIAYEILTGEKPFAGEQITTLVYKIVYEKPATARSLNPTLGPQVEAVLLRGLAKTPEARFATCTEFAVALAAACQSSRGWKPMPRGQSLTMTTVNEASQMTLGTPQLVRAAADRRTSASTMLLLLFLLITCTAMLGWAGWNAGWWPLPSIFDPVIAAFPELRLGGPPPSSTARPPELPPATQAAPAAGAPAAVEPPKTGPAESTPPKVEPSPAETKRDEAVVSPAQAAAEPKTEVIPEPPPPKAPPVRERRQAVPQLPPQPVAVATDPAGATATLDGDPETACRTPCTITAKAGRHDVLVKLEGFEMQRREIVVSDAAPSIPLIRLRRFEGLLLVSSTPDGAAIYVNDRRMEGLTPAQLRLPPGRYLVMVEKNGKRDSNAVEVRDGVTSFVKLNLVK